MNYFIYETILTVLLISQAIQIYGDTPEFPGQYKLWKTIECPVAGDVSRPNTNRKWPAGIDSYDLKPGSTSPMTLDIKWTADMENVKGFRIILKSSGLKDMCRILDYTGAINPSTSGLYSFNFHFKSLRQKRTFTAVLCPLPRLDDDDTSCVSKKFDTTILVPNCAMFAPEITHNYDGRNLKVTLTKPPPSCNFMEYRIDFADKDNNTIAKKIIPIQDNVDKHNALFKVNVCKGLFYIWAAINDPHFSEKTRCMCKGSMGCERCLSQVEGTYLSPAKSCSPEVMPDKHEKPEKNKLLFPLGIVIVILFLIALALYITHWKLSVHMMMKKQGIVLHLDDHKHHTNAVLKLVNYLNEFHLRVSLASAFLKNHDIPDQMVVVGEVLKSDFVLLVLSPALQKRIEAWDKQQDYVEFFKEKNSNILTKTFLELLLASNKLYVCHMDHVTGFGSWPKPSYSIPSDLTRMVAELSGQSFSQRLACCNYLKVRTLGKELRIATEKSIMYEQSHTNWFKDKYVCPTNVAMTQFLADEESHYESIGQSEYTNPLKLKEMFIGYKGVFTGVREEEPIIAPSIYSIPMSERFEELNKRNQ